MKRKAALIPAGQISHGTVHHRGNGPHAHQVKNAGLHVGGEPERQPVVSEIEQRIHFANQFQRAIPETRQHRILRNPHRRIPIGMLPTRLINPWNGVERDPLIGDR